MNPPVTILPQLVASPCCLPSASLDTLLEEYRALGLTKWEGFSEWAESRFDWKTDPAELRAKLNAAGFRVTSFHLPPITEADPEGSLLDALEAARFAHALGAKIVILKAARRDMFASMVPRFLDILEAEKLDLTTVVQNHAGTAITTLEDFREVWESVGDDPRLKAVLEVGHFARVGVPWQTAWEALGERVALIHITDVKTRQSVAYGTGDVDFAGLLKHIKRSGYSGDIVVELELPSRRTSSEETIAELQNALALLRKFYRSA